MSTNLIIFSFIFISFIILFILRLTKKGDINIKYALIWLLLFFLLFIGLIIPGFLRYITNLLGFMTVSNMILCLFIAVLVIINISTMVIVSHQDKKIRLLIQEVSLLKKGGKK